MIAQNPELFLGDDLLAWLVLAFGAALAVGNLAAIIRPPSQAVGEERRPRDRPAPVRLIVMIMIGVVAVIWSLASLVGG